MCPFCKVCSKSKSKLENIDNCVIELSANIELDAEQVAEATERYMQRYNRDTSAKSQSSSDS